MADDSLRPDKGARDSAAPATADVGPRRGRRLVVGVAALAVVALTVGLVVGLGGSGPSLAAAAVVREASRATLAATSSDLTLTGTVVAAGQTVTLNGTGAVDFSRRTGEMHLSTGGASTATTESEVFAGDQAYVSFSAGPASVAALVPGKSWVAIPLPTAASSSSGAGGLVNVLSALQLLQSQGATVTSLGPSTLDGTSVTGYAVTLPTSTLLAAARRAAGTSHVPPAVARAALQAAQNMTMNLAVWVDGSDLLRRLDLSITDLANGTTVDETMRIDLSHYGAAVSVAVPPSSEVASLSQFQSALARLRGSAG